MAKYKGMDTQDLMNRFHHPLIRALLRDFCTKESPAYSFPLAYGNFLSGDGGIPAGGSRKMALRMAERFTSLGGRLFLASPAEKLITEGRRVTALRLKDERLIFADWFVPACDAAFTFETLLDPSYEDPVFRDFWSKPGAYPVYGTFQAAVAVDSGEDLVGGDINLDIADLTAEETGMGDRMAVKSYAYEPSFAPAGKQILQILCGGTSQAYDYFKNLYETDKAAYRERKKEIALRLLRRIEERWPGYAGKLSILDVWTPVTYERYCNAYRGYYQACTIGKKAGKKTAPSPFIRGLENVVLAGQWTIPPGGLPGAAAAGKYAIQRIRRPWRFNRINAERTVLMAAGALAALYGIVRNLAL
jgi:phytoene dehydrogenase-like protein